MLSLFRLGTARSGLPSALKSLIDAEVGTESTFTVVGWRTLFSAAPFYSDPHHAVYDVSPNDQRFVMFRMSQASTGELIWVDNWFQELKAMAEN